MTNVLDTPDGQRGTVSAGQLLASVNANVANVTVAIPPNAETLVIAVPQAIGQVQVRITGTVTGFVYPASYRFADAKFGADFVVALDVSSQLDDSVNIVFLVAPTSQWYVFVETGISIMSVPEITALLGSNGSGGVPSFGIMSMGYDGSANRYVSTDVNGRQIPLVPTVGASFGTAGGSLKPLLPALNNGRYYLFGLDVAAAGNTAVVMDAQFYVAGTAIAEATSPANTSIHIDFQGYATASALSIFTTANANVYLRYALGQ